MSKKYYCHQDNCDIVKTGFQIETYHVCRTCKEEVSENLANIKAEEKKLADTKFVSYEVDDIEQMLLELDKMYTSI